MILRKEDAFIPGEFPIFVERLPSKRFPNAPAHSHDFSEITLVLSGSADHICNGQRVKVKPTDILLIHPGTVHHFENDSSFDAVSLYYDPSVPYAPLANCELELIREIYPDPDMNHPDQAVPLLSYPLCDQEVLLNILLRMRYEIRHNRIGHQIIAMALYMEFFAYISRGYSMELEARTDAQLQRAIEWLNRNYMEKISIPYLAKIIGISQSSLFHKFKEAYDKSPYDYLIQLRLFHAKQQIQEKRRSISEIALRCGFYDSNQFSKLFRKNFGISPKQFQITGLKNSELP